MSSREEAERIEERREVGEWGEVGERAEARVEEKVDERVPREARKDESEFGRFAKGRVSSEKEGRGKSRGSSGKETGGDETLEEAAEEEDGGGNSFVACSQARSEVLGRGVSSGSSNRRVGVVGSSSRDEEAVWEVERVSSA